LKTRTINFAPGKNLDPQQRCNISDITVSSNLLLQAVILHRAKFELLLPKGSHWSVSTTLTATFQLFWYGHNS